MLTRIIGSLLALPDGTVLAVRSLTNFEKGFAEFRLQHYLFLYEGTNNFRHKYFLRKEIRRVKQQLKNQMIYGSF